MMCTKCGQCSWKTENIDCFWVRTHSNLTKKSCLKLEDPLWYLIQKIQDDRKESPVKPCVWERKNRTWTKNIHECGVRFNEISTNSRKSINVGLHSTIDHLTHRVHRAAVSRYYQPPWKKYSIHKTRSTSINKEIECRKVKQPTFNPEKPST